MAEEILTHISDPVFPAYTVNVLDYGAVPNDGKLDTAAIQRAIDETSAHGGGTVVIPSGVYDVGAITLKSNVNLHLETRTPSCASPGTSPRPTTRWCSPTTKAPSCTTGAR